LEIAQYIIIPESDHSESVCFQPARPRRIFLDFLGMLGTIDLDYQSMSKATEIDNVVTDWMLAAKL
jgi:hypothetical protein